MNIREEGRSSRVRNRPKPQPAKKTRVNAQRYGGFFVLPFYQVQLFHVN